MSATVDWSVDHIHELTFSTGTGTLRCPYRRKWRLTDADLRPIAARPTMVSHSVESWPLTKLNGGLSRLHCADEDAVSWLTNCGSWHAYENKKLLLNTNGIQPLRVTPKQPGIRAPILELWRILTYYYGLLFDIRQFHVASQMLSTQCDCHNLLITLIAGLCLQHLTPLREVRFVIIATACC